MLRAVASSARRLLLGAAPATGGGGSNLIGAARGFRITARMGRGMPQRVSMLRNMVTSLIEHERIKTGHAKARQVARLSPCCSKT